MIVTRTPYRVSFFGGGTDYPSWYKEHGGAVLGATINKYCWIAVRKPNPFGPRFKLVYNRVETCEKLDDICHPAVRETLRYLGVDGVDLHHWSDLPARSGMGSSSAFVVGMLNALKVLTGHPCHAGGLAEEAVYIEQKLLKETVGSQDQILTAHGGVNVVLFEKEGGDWENGWKVRNLDYGTNFREEGRRRLKENLMLFFTGVQRTASDVAASYVGDFLKHKDTMTRLTGMVQGGLQCLRDGRFDDFGRLLDEAWQWKKRLGSGVTTQEVDALYFKARMMGALGGKLLGAGGGGFLLLYVPQENQEYVRRALEGLVEVPFSFESEGSTVVYSGGD